MSAKSKVVLGSIVLVIIVMGVPGALIAVGLTFLVLAGFAFTFVWWDWPDGEPPGGYGEALVSSWVIGVYLLIPSPVVFAGFMAPSSWWFWGLIG